jgi:anaerobic ribonucleoside-triphosphate reductase activating protein
VQSLAKSLKNNVHQIEGITISGGEPLLQIPALTKLLWLVKRQSNLSVILFSGFTWPQIQILPGIKEVMDSVDVLLAGPYQKGLRTPNSLAGSSNKTVHFLSKRYSIEDLQFIPPAEIIITTGGEIHLSGLDPIKW